jgi:hypothetical protein
VAEPTSGPRAAQIQAVREVLGWPVTSDDTVEERIIEVANELVDAVHAAGRDQDEVVNATETADSAARRYAGEIWRLASGLADRDVPLAPDAPIDTAPVDTALATIDQLRYERHLLGVARMTLDLVAAGDPTRWDQARAEAGDVAQRIVDEIGHPVTDEPALGPELRAENARLTAEVAEAMTGWRKVTQGYLIAAHECDQAVKRADQGEARGWAKAVQALTDVDRYRAWWRQVDSTDDDFVRMPDRRALARYLEALGPDGTAEVAPNLGTVTPEDQALVARATGGRITSREIQPEYDDPATAAETGQAGRGASARATKETAGA